MPTVHPLKCPKCESEMEEGFVKDATHGGVAPSEWIEGPMERSFWTGVKTKGRVRHEIQTYRCTKCGFLESYAG